VTALAVAVDDASEDRPLTDVIRVLLAAGADPAAPQGPDGLSAFDLVEQLDRPFLLPVLQA
jgi:hypothetical protein